MSVRKRIILPALFGIVTCVGISLYASLPQYPERSYSLEGAWYCSVNMPGIPIPVPYMDLYTSDSNRPGISGTVLCTLAVGKLQSPMGLVSMTQAAHGNWIRVGHNMFAFTAWRILIDADGHPVGSAKFWGTVTPVAEDLMTGTLNVEYYDSRGKSFYVVRGGSSTGKRVEVQVEGQQ